MHKSTIVMKFSLALVIKCAFCSLIKVVFKYNESTSLYAVYSDGVYPQPSKVAVPYFSVRSSDILALQILVGTCLTIK